jgi:acyl carrier protein
MKPGMLVLFEQHHPETALSRKITQGRSGRAAPNNQDIGSVRTHSAGRRSALDNFHTEPMMQASKNHNVTPKDAIMQPQSEFEKEVAELIVEALNLEDIEAEAIDPEEALFVEGLALDSIDALELALAITQKYDVKFKADDAEVQQVFGSLRTLSAYIAGHKS